jgi:flagellar M-ring protein FliF
MPGAERPVIDLRRIATVNPTRMLAFLVGVAAIAAVAIGGFRWARTPDYRRLYSNLSDRDGGAVVAALGTMNVPYRVAEGGGAILVPGEMVHDTRLKLASQGLPKGSIVGFELVDGQKFGATQFQEQINFQRGLEGELARSIQSLGSVAGARVHLAIPKPSVFARESAQPTASVLVTLHAGRTLDRAQVSGIVHLVASSVPELSIDRVSVLDQNGTLLSRRREDDGNGLDPSQLAYVKQVEQATIQRIVDILEPVVGRGNVRAQVTADVDFRRVESVAETFKPNGDPTSAAVRSSQVNESSTPNGAGGAAQGIPGALSNQPPPHAQAPIDGRAAAATNAAAASAAVQVATRKDAATAYEVDKTIQHTRNAGAGLRRLSAAVVINYRRPAAPPAADGAAAARPAPVALSDKEMEQLNGLVREAMGFSKERGDSLAVANAAFSEPEAAPVVETPWWKSADTISIAKDVARYGAYALLLAWLWFGVGRPMLRRATAPLEAQPVGPMSYEAAAAAGGAQVGVDPLVRARQLARDDPKIVANVVRTWVAKNE